MTRLRPRRSASDCYAAPRRDAPGNSNSEGELAVPLGSDGQCCRESEPDGSETIESAGTGWL